ncbi:hypothetical protein F7725_026134 [Dissostichus mawsoni]|uniref:BTB/POZ domain-containing protein KCTD3 n=1 Tax=Dissostichus mawsoni TaxID=36200 RepID=A0A7J5X756_DISMA|nr:hypothetical protein F7725_026134 [Dissostichus mawsoni]
MNSNLSPPPKVQDVVPITSCDTAGSFLLLGCNNGSIYYIDMQKFPLRMKDNDLLVTELYHDPSNDAITALCEWELDRDSVRDEQRGRESNCATPGDSGSGPQLFQTFTVHRSPVTKIMLSEKHLVSVCADNNHVRTWTVTRFRGMISTQPGSTPLASFKILSLEETESHGSYGSGNDIGPFGERDDQQVFIQKVIPITNKLFVRLSSTGKRICEVQAVDLTTISCFMVRECEGSSRMGSRPRRYLFTGHGNGGIQMWDLTTAMDNANKGEEKNKEDVGGPSEEELLQLLDQCDLSTSRCARQILAPPPLCCTTHASESPAQGYLQLQAQEPIPESQATYGAVRPYRESPCWPEPDALSPSTATGMLDSTGPPPPPGPTQTADVRRSLCDFGPDDSERRASALEFWACRSSSSSSNTITGATATAAVSAVKTESGPESPRQPPDSPIPGARGGGGGGIRGRGGKAEGVVRKRGVLEGGFLGRKRAPPVPHLSSVTSGSEGGGSDSSSNASPSPTKLSSSTSPRHRKLAPELSNQDSSL